MILPYVPVFVPWVFAALFIAFWWVKVFKLQGTLFCPKFKKPLLMFWSYTAATLILCGILSFGMYRMVSSASFRAGWQAKAYLHERYGPSNDFSTKSIKNPENPEKIDFVSYVYGGRKGMLKVIPDPSAPESRFIFEDAEVVPEVKSQP